MSSHNVAVMLLSDKRMIAADSSILSLVFHFVTPKSMLPQKKKMGSFLDIFVIY